MVVANKQLFHASKEAVDIAQSVCQQHVYHVWLWGKPLIVSTHVWEQDDDVDEFQRSWLERNAVYKHITEPTRET